GRSGLQQRGYFEPSPAAWRPYEGLLGVGFGVGERMMDEKEWLKSSDHRKCWSTFGKMLVTGSCGCLVWRGVHLDTRHSRFPPFVYPDIQLPLDCASLGQ